MDYKSSGVDIEAGYKSVELMKQYVKTTMRPEVLGGLGGFSGAFSLEKIKDMEKPTLVSGTDGVGTKIKLAFLMDKHDTIGIDCVAMCVNDIACAGGEPLFFLDYIACGKMCIRDRYLGAHYTKERTTFRTFAPSAAGVELVLNGQGHGMQRVHDGNFYEITLDQLKEGDLYEFRIWHRDGSCQEHCDPYGFGMELRPAHKSVVRDLNRYAFTDEKWLKDREDISTKPLNIYEVHACLLYTSRCV